MFEIAAVKHNAVQNVIRTTGKSEEMAAMHYEREKILFFKALKANPAIEKCDRFSIYSSWIELMVSGSTLNEGNSFLIPYGKVLQFQMGWRGRLEQLIQIPTILNIPPPQVVYENDEFEYELGDKPRIIKHKPAKKDRGELAFVYVVIQKDTGRETHLMTREEIHNVRDRYSKTYIQYVKEVQAQNKKIGEPVTKQMTGPNGPWTLTIDPPMWVTSPEEAWKKTLINRAYKYQPKTARMKALDAKLKDRIDPETGTQERTEDIDYSIIDDTKGAPPQEPPATNSAAPASAKAADPTAALRNVLSNPADAF